VPRNYTPDTPLPVIFAWHGMGGSGSVARSYFRIDSAVANRAIIVYPDGLPVNDGSTGWDLNATGIDVAFFDALLTYVSDNYCIDRDRVFSTGHSYGGMFTNALACYRGDVLRASAPVAGMPPSAYGRGVTCTGNVAALIIHGENDPTVDYTRGGIGGKDFWVAQNDCSTMIDPTPITPAACLEYQDCQPDLPVVFCTHTEGHDWPTANGAGCSDGGICFDAGSIIWTFFSRFE
jgi:poly(3-hydroxybutyrate) depolymerase